MRTVQCAPRRQRGMVMFVALVLLLVLTLLGVSLARIQTVEERLARNDANHQLALQSAEAALQAGFDADAAGIFTDLSYTKGMDSLADEIFNGTVILGYNPTWGVPGTNSQTYNGTALASAPLAAQMQYVIENLPPASPPTCPLGNAGNPGAPQVWIHRITAHALGGDGSASATVQTIRMGGC